MMMMAMRTEEGKEKEKKGDTHNLNIKHVEREREKTQRNEDKEMKRVLPQQNIDQRHAAILHRQAGEEARRTAPTVSPVHFNQVLGALRDAMPRALTVDEIFQDTRINLALASNSALLAQLEKDPCVEVVHADDPAARAYKFRPEQNIDSVDKLVEAVNRRYPYPYDPERDRSDCQGIKRLVKQAIRERRVLAFTGKKKHGTLRMLMANPQLFEPLPRVDDSLRRAWNEITPQDTAQLPDDERWGIYDPAIPREDRGLRRRTTEGPPAKSRRGRKPGTTKR